MTDGRTLEEVRDEVRKWYAGAARAVMSGGEGSCCASSCCGGAPAASTTAGARGDPITRDIYGAEEAAAVPADAVAASLGCGNPTALAELRAGETVLDLGSGGGIDVLLSARRVGPRGKAYGLDMTDEMLALARRNQAAAGVENVEFLKGTIEEVPLPDASVDVIISNCVINLSAQKDRVLREAFRVLKPGGRFAVSDVVWLRPPPEEIRRSLELWAGCVAGALLEGEYVRKLAAAGFTDIGVEVTRRYRLEDARGLVPDEVLAAVPDLAALDGAVASAFVRARKPA